MNKKFLMGSIIAVVLIVGGGVGYYFYNQASADVFTESYCSGLTGNSWKNCSQNMATWRKYISTHSNSQFTKALNFIEKGGNPSNPGPVVVPEPTPTTTGNPTPTITPVPAPTVLPTPTPTATVSATPTPSASPIIGPVTGCQGATLYGAVSFNAPSACYTVGSYLNFTPKVPGVGIANDSASSIKVEPGYTATLYMNASNNIMGLTDPSLTIISTDGSNDQIANLATKIMTVNPLGGNVTWDKQASALVVKKN